MVIILSPGQTLNRNISTQHIATLSGAFGHPVATCCNMLRHVECCWLKFENGQNFHATFVDVAWCCGSLTRFVRQCWPGNAHLFDFQLATCRNTLKQGLQKRATCSAKQCCDHLARACKCWANNVRICYVEVLLSFGRGSMWCNALLKNSAFLVFLWSAIICWHL